MKRTKIVCTIGPSSESAEMLRKLVIAGMNVARLNFSHGAMEEHAQRIEAIRKIEAELGKPIAILQDLPGPKIRTGDMQGMVELQQGRTFVFTTRSVPGDAEEINLPYPELVAQAAPGQQIFVADGQLEFRVESATDTDIITKVIVGGMIGGRKGVNMPGAKISVPSVTEKDLAALDFGLKYDVDWVAASFVRCAADLDPVRSKIASSGKSIRLIAKIEKSEAVSDIDSIIEAADGIMVARGDLGVEIPLERVPAVQKSIIKKCNLAGKPVITATQMLESMIGNRRPTRAEVTDVANAILDGTDAVMLSGETAIGEFPVDTVTTMSKIAVQAEISLNHRHVTKQQTHGAEKSVTDAIAQGTVDIAIDLQAKAIITPTSSGATARAVSKYRPETPIIAAATTRATYRQLALSWGIYPVVVAQTRNTDDMLEEAVEGAKRAKLVHDGDIVVLTAGVPAGVPGRTNLIKVQVVGQAITT
ncbi:MAG TPA: pyruvate kinase [Armatimonadetes bacterium]|jgi:pyruvate kinase|nr:pyruvate kinase [Armatimonadota bacterium]